MPKLRLVTALLPLALAAAACTPPPAPRTAADPGAIADAAASAIPVDASDPQRGPASAPVTVVVFGDYHCPHCRRANATLAQLAQRYGDRLRVVWKHYPQDDEDAVAAAVLASGLHHLGGDGAFWAFHDGVYGERRAGDTLESMVAVGLAKARERQPLETKAIAAAAREEGVAKVKADVELGDKLEIKALPTLFVNGTRMIGVGSQRELVTVIDAELVAAEATKGDPSQRYAARVRENLKREPVLPAGPPPDDDADDADVEPIDDTNFRVPVAGAPARGNPEALVTIVEFGDFQCPHCARAQKTLHKIAARYGDKVRFVFRNNPLAFHDHAEAAAELALEIRAKKGDAAFWSAHDALYEREGAIDDAALRAVASAAGLDPDAALEAVKRRAHEAQIEADLFVADDVGVRGTPYFFVNGRKLRGAQNFATFAAVIDEEHKQAEELVRAGVASRDVYEKLVADGRVEPLPERSTDAALHLGAKASAPRAGDRRAPVEIHVFADFQCPHCAAQADALHALREAFPGDVTVLFHELPLSFHSHARDAAIAALEARRQKGDASFWKLHDAMFADQASLGRDDLAALFRSQGLDEKALRAAWDDGRFDKELAADAALAAKVGAEGTPTTFIDGYALHGAQSVVHMKKIVRKVLADAAAPKPKAQSKSSK